MAIAWPFGAELNQAFRIHTPSDMHIPRMWAQTTIRALCSLDKTLARLRKTDSIFFYFSMGSVLSSSRRGTYWETRGTPISDKYRAYPSEPEDDNPTRNPGPSRPADPCSCPSRTRICPMCRYEFQFKVRSERCPVHGGPGEAKAVWCPFCGH